MLVTKSVDVRDNFKSLCDQVYRGKTVVVSRPRNENIIMISEKVYNELQKAKRNVEYQKIIDKSIKDIENKDIVINKIKENKQYKNIIWSNTSLEQYKWWELNDKNIVKKIDELIDSIISDGALKGKGNPEELKYIYGYNRYMDIDNRLLYYINNDNNIVILTCKGHYEY